MGKLDEKPGSEVWLRSSGERGSRSSEAGQDLSRKRSEGPSRGGAQAGGIPGRHSGAAPAVAVHRRGGAACMSVTEEKRWEGEFQDKIQERSRV